MDDCPGSRVEWTVLVDGSEVMTGVLDENQREATIDAAVLKQPEKVTVSARRTDEQPCVTVFRWNEPTFLD